jgi:hypothetical protein
LLGTVPVGVVLLPGVHGFATVDVVPLGRDGVAEATVELELPLVPLLVVDVLGVAEVELLGVVEVVLLGVVVVEVEVPALVLLDGVHGATVVVVPVWFCMLPVVPVTDPALPATPGVPCVTAGLPVEVLGCDVGRVPTELGCVVAEPGWVVVEPGCVVVPGCDCVVEVPVCVPIPGLGVTVPVLCAVAMPTARANTDDANKILRIESCSLCTFSGQSFSHWNHSLSKALLAKWDAFSTAERCRGRVAGSDYFSQLQTTDLPALWYGSGRWTNAVLCFYPSACT